MDSLFSMELHCPGAVPASYSGDSSGEGTSAADVQVLQALVVMSVVHMWNGTSQQRTRARKAFPQVASQARRLGLLHQTGPANVVIGALVSSIVGALDVGVDSLIRGRTRTLALSFTTRELVG